MSRSSRTWRAVTTVAAIGLLVSACGTTDDDGGNGGGGGGDCDGTIAFVGPQTGDYANLGINITNGANVALEEFKADNPDCDVSLEAFDSQGDPEKANGLVTEIINGDFIGVMGPTFSGESDSTGDAFAEAGLVTVSPSATNPDLTDNGWDTFHRVLGNDATQAPSAANYIKEDMGSTKVFVVDDASEYGKGIADIVRDELGDLVLDNDTVQQKQTDFSATVTRVKASGADTLFYGGYYPEAGLLAKQLVAGDWDGTFVSGDGSKDPGFVEAAGATSAEGAILTCPCAPSPDDFAARYSDANDGAEPGTYSAEGYDVANIFLEGIADGNTDRESMLEWVNNYDEDGLTKHIAFDESGEVTEIRVWAYKVEGGEIVDIAEIT